MCIKNSHARVVGPAILSHPTRFVPLHKGWGRIPSMGILHTAWALEVARYGARLTNQPFIAQLITSTKQRVGAQLYT